MEICPKRDTRETHDLAKSLKLNSPQKFKIRSRNKLSSHFRRRPQNDYFVDLWAEKWPHLRCISPLLGPGLFQAPKIGVEEANELS